MRNETENENENENEEQDYLVTRLKRLIRSFVRTQSQSQSQSQSSSSSSSVPGTSEVLRWLKNPLYRSIVGSIVGSIAENGIVDPDGSGVRVTPSFFRPSGKPKRETKRDTLDLVTYSWSSNAYYVLCM